VVDQLRLLCDGWASVTQLGVTAVGRASARLPIRSGVRSLADWRGCPMTALPSPPMSSLGEKRARRPRRTNDSTTECARGYAAILGCVKSKTSLCEEIAPRSRRSVSRDVAFRSASSQADARSRLHLGVAAFSDQQQLVRPLVEHQQRERAGARGADRLRE